MAEAITVHTALRELSLENTRVGGVGGHRFGAGAGHSAAISLPRLLFHR